MAENAIRKPGRESRKHTHPARKTATTQAKSQAQTQAQVQSPTTVSQYTTVETSVEVVQTLTQAVVSSMARLRHLFDDDNYAAKLIDMTDAKKSGNALQFESLKRGVTSRADRLLDWTEKGAGDAIKRGYLRSLKFAIYEDKTRPNDRLEEWVLYYDYHTDETGQRIVSHVSLAEEVHRHGHKITISQAKRALGNFIADMAHVCTECLPDLPPVVRVTVNLDMNEDAPIDYCPPGLVSYVAENTRFADTEDWECRTRSVAKMNAGHHEVKLKVNYLAPRHDDFSNVVPSGLPCTKEILATSEIRADPATATDPLLKPGERTSGKTTAEISRNQNTHPSSSAKKIGSDRDNSRLDRHSSADMQAKNRFARMLPPSTKNTDVQATQTRDSGKFTEQALEHSPLVYSRAKLEALDQQHFPLPLYNGPPNIIRHDGVIDEATIINCECGQSSEEGDMICCAVCNKFQHLHCLGYNSAADDRITMHVCYPCLLHGESPQQLHKVREMSLCRRVIYWLQVKNYDSIRQLAHDLGWKEAACSKIVRCLRLQGVLEGSGSSRTIMLDTSPVGKAKLDEAYFDPTKGISDHLEASPQMDQTSASGSKQHEAPSGTRKRPHENERDVDGTPAKRHKEVFGPPSDIAGGDHSTPRADRKRRGGPVQQLASP